MKSDIVGGDKMCGGKDGYEVRCCRQEKKKGWMNV